MQGEVEIPFSSPSFVQIKFHSLIFVKIFLQLHFCAYFPGTQVKFIFTKKTKQILVRHLPLQASLYMGRTKEAISPKEATSQFMCILKDLSQIFVCSSIIIICNSF